MRATIKRPRPGNRGLAKGFYMMALAAAATFSPALAQQTPQRAPAAPVPGSVEPGMPAPGPVGTWIDHTGRGAVEISQCGPDLCGRIVWMKQPLDRTGQPLRDKLNENARLRTRAICGLQVIGQLKQMRDGTWDRGWIYDPEQGESFDVAVRLRGNDVLQVTGYKGIKFLSETFQWRRATAPLEPACPATNPA